MDVEQKYIEGLKRGVYKDFTWLYDRYASHLYSFVFNMVRSESVAKDIVQETFIKLWISRERINLNYSFKSYLFTIAKNRLINELRNQLNRPMLLEDVELKSKEYQSEEIIEREIALQEFRQNLEKAKQKLTPRQRELFELNKEQGLSVTEIASMTSISEQSVRNQLSQAIQQLRKDMESFCKLFTLFFF